MMKKIILLIVFFFFIIGVFFFSSVDAKEKKFLILAIDGMDYTLLNEMMKKGEMPNFDKLRKKGDFKPLLSSIPPQSPVAWSNFITGMDPGGHGIFDFIHRTPEDITPYLSTSKTVPPSKVILFGKYRIPLKSGKIELLRKGKAFWEILEENGIPATIIFIPSNFPPVKSAGRSLSGMGTPDILGTYGTFTFLTTDPQDIKEISGGKIHYVEIENNRLESFIPGPINTLIKGNPSTKVDMTIYIDPENDVAKIVIQNKEILLMQGEWSNFVEVEFTMIPWFVKVSGIVRFYLKQVHPHFKLYISPVNINPANPAMPITNPENYAKELYNNIGYFYTLGMAEDTKALESGILSEDEFLTQSQLVLQERLKILDYELKRFKRGLLFFYISIIDLSSHMFWRFMTKDHPHYNNENFKNYRDTIYRLYKQMDDILANLFKYVDDNTVLMVMSDHGFKELRRLVNINTWLAKEGYIKLSPNWSPKDKYFTSVNWSNTKAYAIGINSLYINLKGREYNGIVKPGDEYKELVDEIAKKLEAMIDPKTGKHVIKKAYKKYEIYHGPYIDMAPDIIIGFSRGYGSSEESSLGQFSEEVIVDNLKKWSGDHCMDYREVPGIILINRKIKQKEPSLYDLAPTILKEFGIEPPKDMVGKSIY